MNSSLWESMPEWWKRLETLRALRRPLTEEEWIEFLELEDLELKEDNNELS